jgi:hypothetical protein
MRSFGSSQPRLLPPGGGSGNSALIGNDHATFEHDLRV